MKACESAPILLVLTGPVSYIDLPTCILLDMLFVLISNHIRLSTYLIVCQFYKASDLMISTRIIIIIIRESGTHFIILCTYLLYYHDSLCYYNNSPHSLLDIDFLCGVNTYCRFQICIALITC